MNTPGQTDSTIYLIAYNMNQRDISIDILKFIAVFLIINSHMDALYPKYKMLATGGAIGDVLFLFASGYTLFLSNRKLRFDNWYKRRINRIYPSVIVCAIIGTLFSEKQYITLLSIAIWMPCILNIKCWLQEER